MVWDGNPNRRKGESPHRKGVGIHQWALVSWGKWKLPSVQWGLERTGPAVRVFGWLFTGKPALPLSKWREQKAAISTDLLRTGLCARASWESTTLGPTTAGLFWLARSPRGGVRSSHKTGEPGPGALQSGVERLLTVMINVGPKPNPARAWASGMGLSPCTDHFSQKEINF